MKDIKNALPQFKIEDMNTLPGFMETVLRLHDIGVESMLPAMVTEYNRSSHTATIIPLVKYEYDTLDGKKYADRDTIDNVPVVQMYTNGFIFDIPMSFGTTGFILASDREWSLARAMNSNIEENKNAGPCPQSVKSLAKFANGVFFPCSFIGNGLRNNDGMVLGYQVGGKNDYKVMFKEGEMLFDGAETRTLDVVTDVRVNEVTGSIEKKTTNIGINGDFIVRVGDESEWKGTKIIKMTAMTEWKFIQDDYGSPVAKINDVAVCSGHSTSHIIDYKVTSGDVEEHYDPETGLYTFDFTMSIEVEDGKPGGPCVFRCWNNEYSTFDETPEDEKASISGTDKTTAKFKITFNKATEKWKYSKA